MADPFGAASAAAGVISLGLTVCQGLLTYYSTWKDAPQDVKQMRKSMEELMSVLQHLRSSTAHDTFGPSLRQTIRQSIDSCEDGLMQLKSELERIKITPGNNTWNERTKAGLRRILYPLREGTVTKLTTVSNELRDNLNLALQAMSLDASITSIVRTDAHFESNLYRMKRLEGQVTHVINMSQSNSLLALSSMGVLHDSIEQTRIGVDGLISSSIDENLLKVYDWLFPLSGSFENKQLDVFNVKSRQDGLGRWLLETPEFKTWRESTGKTLWCCGEPGVGKTVLASFVIDFLRNNSSTQDEGIAFVYCSYKEVAHQTPANMVASILHQLVMQKGLSHQALIQLYKTHSWKKTRPTIGDYSKLLQHVTTRFSKVRIVIDALDEYPETNQSRQTFLEEIKQLNCVSIFVTSRNMPMEDWLENVTPLIVRAWDTDIQNYIEQRLLASDRIKRFCKRDSSLGHTIKETIIGKAKGMFLLAVLYLESLMTKNDLRTLKDALKSLPEGLDATYEGAMQRIEAQSVDDFKLATKILCWIIYAFRPLTVTEIQTALAIRPNDHELDEEGIPDQETLLSVCAGIVIIEEEGQIINLVHHTAQEYFKEHGAKHFPSAQADIAMTCLTYISLDMFGGGPYESDGELEKKLENYPLLGYAVMQWGHHFKLDPNEPTKSLIRSFLKQTPKVALSVQIINTTILTPPGDQELRQKTFKQNYESLHSIHSLWLMAYFGLHSLAKEIMDTNIDMSIRTGYGETALHAAVRSKSMAMVKQLIHAGYDVNAINQSKVTPLIIAASRLEKESGASNMEEIIRLLVENQANIAATDLTGETALYEAAKNGNETVVKFLIDHGAELSCTSEDGMTPLHAAAEGENSAVVKLLLKSGADTAAVDKFGYSPLCIAADRGDLEMVEFLINNGSDVNIRTVESWTALSLAARYGHTSVVKLLVANDADPHIVRDDGRGPLHTAVKYCHLEIVKFLLANGADSATPDIDGWTPLHFAAENNCSEIMSLLLSKGADPNTHNSSGWAPLDIATQNGHFETVKLLASLGADPTVLNVGGKTPLILAATSGHLEIIRLLLSNGRGPNISDNKGITPLFSASGLGFLEGVKLLISSGADLTIPTNDGWTPLNIASQNGHLEVVDFLLENGADSSVASNTNTTPLISASAGGHLEIVRLLLKNGADLTTVDTDGWTPLTVAARHGHIETVKVLQQHGADLNAGTKAGYVPLHFTASGHNPEMAKYLLEKGADWTIPSKEGVLVMDVLMLNDSVEVFDVLLDKVAPSSDKRLEGHALLYSAIFKSSTKIVESLLRRGVDVNISNNDGKTPLQAASALGHSQIVPDLLEKGADLEAKDLKDGRTPLSLAAAEGFDIVVKQLLDKGADMESKDATFGLTPLSLAAIKGFEIVVKQLLEKGADIESKDSRYGLTPLSLAAKYGHEAVVELLLAKENIDQDSKDNWGRTPLIWSALNGREGVMKILLNAGVDPNSKDRYGRTALAGAAVNGHKTSVKLLLAADGIDPSIEDIFGRTSLSEARRMGHIDIVKLLSDDDEQVNIAVNEKNFNDTPDQATPVDDYVSCDICDMAILDTHHHCEICDNGDFDICEDCLMCGGFCSDNSHKLVKRKFQNGVFEIYN